MASARAVWAPSRCSWAEQVNAVPLDDYPIADAIWERPAKQGIDKRLDPANAFCCPGSSHGGNRPAGRRPSDEFDPVLRRSVVDLPCWQEIAAAGQSASAGSLSRRATARILATRTGWGTVRSPTHRRHADAGQVPDWLARCPRATHETGPADWNLGRGCSVGT